MKSLAILTVAAGLASAESPIGPPEIGFIQATDGTFRPVRGVAANFVLSKPAASGVVCGAFSGTFGLVKTASELTVTDAAGKSIASQAAPAGGSLFAFALNGKPALVYFESTKSLLAWNGRSFVAAHVEASAVVSGSVVSIAAAPAGMAALVVERDHGLWEIRVRLDSGAIASQSAITGVTGPVLLMPSGEILYGNTGGLMIRRTDGSEKRISGRLPKNFALQPMGAGWISISDLDTRRRYAARIVAGQERFYALPEVSQ